MVPSGAPGRRGSPEFRAIFADGRRPAGTGNRPRDVARKSGKMKKRFSPANSDEFTLFLARFTPKCVFLEKENAFWPVPVVWRVPVIFSKNKKWYRNLFGVFPLFLIGFFGGGGS